MIEREQSGGEGDSNPRYAAIRTLAKTCCYQAPYQLQEHAATPRSQGADQGK